jgi:hypothetical protein
MNAELTAIYEKARAARACAPVLEEVARYETLIERKAEKEKGE